jgi:hypothetical protein
MSDPPVVTSPTDIFPNADLTNLLCDHFTTNTLIDKLVKYVKLIPNFNVLKLEPEITKLLMNIIKDEIKSKETDQEDILIQALTQTFNLTSDEIAVIKQQIIFLKNNSLIVGIPMSKKIFKSTTKWIFRKLG